MKPLPPPRGRTTGLIDWLTDFHACFLRARPKRNELCEINETPDGTEILPRLGRGINGSAAGETEFIVTDASRTNGLAAVHCTWGRINGIRPDDFTPRGRLFKNIPRAGFLYGKVTFDLARWAISKTEVIVSTSQKSSTYRIGYRLIAEWETVDGGLVIISPGGSFDLTICSLPDQA